MEDYERVRDILTNQGFEVTIEPKGELMEVMIRAGEHGESYTTSKSKLAKKMIEIAQKLARKKPRQRHDYNDDVNPPNQTK